MRDRVFGVSPCLNKIPLFKYSPNTKLYQGAHFILGANISKIRGAVLHFKFLNNFVDKVFEELRRKQHYKNGKQYAGYAEQLNKNCRLNPYFYGSAEYQNTKQLVDLNIMRTAQGWSML